MPNSPPAGVPIAHFPVDSFLSNGALSEAWNLRSYIRRHGIRLVHAFDYPLTLFAVPVARCATRAVVASSQRSHRELIPSRYRPLMRITDRMAHAVVVNCEFVRRHLEIDEGVPSSASSSAITAWIWRNFGRWPILAKA